MRRRSPYVLFGLAVCLLLAACGQTTGSNLGPGSSGAVQVSVDATTYHSSDPISVAIANQSSSDIYVADHQSQCTIVQLQTRSGNDWQQIGKCAVMTPTRMHQVGHNSTQVVTLTAPHGGWPAGAYRVSLSYSQTAQPTNTTTQAYSPEFQVNA